MAKQKKKSEAQHDREFDHAMTVLKKHYHRMMDRKGVTGLDVNYRTRKGKLTDEVVIRVHVQEKLDREDLHPNQIIEEIEGVPVDIVEAENDYTATIAGGDQAGISPVLNGAPSNEYGTFGVACFDIASGEPRGVTNAHVVLGGQTKSSLPSKVPMVLNTTKAAIGNAIMSKCFLTSAVDCALIEPADGIDFEAGVDGLMSPPGNWGELTRSDLRKQVKVRKLGAKTGETVGRLASITQSFNADGHNFLFQIAIRPIDGNAFSGHGDSGSVVIKDGRVVGLLHGLANNGSLAIACHFKDVVQQLGIRF